MSQVVLVNFIHICLFFSVIAGVCGAHRSEGEPVRKRLRSVAHGEPHDVPGGRPWHFNDDGSATKGVHDHRGTLEDLPEEMVLQVIKVLSQADIMRLRASCRFFYRFLTTFETLDLGYFRAMQLNNHIRSNGLSHPQCKVFGQIRELGTLKLKLNGIPGSDVLEVKPEQRFSPLILQSLKVEGANCGNGDPILRSREFTGLRSVCIASGTAALDMRTAEIIKSSGDTITSLKLTLAAGSQIQGLFSRLPVLTQLQLFSYDEAAVNELKAYLCSPQSISLRSLTVCAQLENSSIIFGRDNTDLCKIIADMRGIEKIHLYRGITPASVYCDCLKELRNLRCLALTVGANEHTELSKLSSLNNLDKVKLYGASACALSALEPLTTLRSLKASDIHGGNWEPLGRLTGLTNLTLNFISDINVDTQTAMQISAALVHLTGLLRLGLSLCDGEFEGAVDLQGLSVLERLDLEEENLGMTIKPHWPRQVHGIGSARNLKWLSTCNSDDGRLEDPYAFLHGVPLEVYYNCLSFSNNMFHVVMSAIRHLPRLRVFGSPEGMLRNMVWTAVDDIARCKRYFELIAQMPCLEVVVFNTQEQVERHMIDVGSGFTDGANRTSVTAVLRHMHKTFAAKGIKVIRGEACRDWKTTVRDHLRRPAKLSPITDAQAQALYERLSAKYADDLLHDQSELTDCSGSDYESGSDGVGSSDDTDRFTGGDSDVSHLLGLRGGSGGN